MLDGDKLFKILTNNEQLKDIPILYIVRITECVILAINSGKCISKLEDL